VAATDSYQSKSTAIIMMRVFPSSYASKR